MTCMFCESDVDGNRVIHPECWAEFDRRSDANACIRCGRPVGYESDAWCDACHSRKEKPLYAGYPGSA